MQKHNWEDTGQRGKHGRIYQDKETGEFAEEHGGFHLLPVGTDEVLPERFNGHVYLIEKDRIARSLPV